MQKLKSLPLVLSLAWGCAKPAQTSTAPAPASATPAQSQQTSTPARNAPGAGAVSTPNADPFPSTYRVFPSRVTVIRNATILTAAGPAIPNGTVVLRDGKIDETGAT